MIDIFSFIIVSDRSKIENLPNLIDLSINQNPLEIIPPFNNTKIQFLSLQDTLLTSAVIPPSYNNSVLQTITLNNNKIRIINENDFLFLRYSKLHKLTLDSASISLIDRNAFIPLTQLQSLSLINNQLKSCEFLSNLPITSIKLDENQFTSLPQQLSTPGRIKTYSFKHNLISIIDESSPLYMWFKKNITNIQIYLANNSFDCCLSLWFIRFLKTSSQIIPDASALKCATPSKFAGELLTKLNPDEMNCNGDIPNKSWWTTARIIGIIIGCAVTISIIIIIVAFIRFRRHPSRSGYQEIDDHLYTNIDPSISGGPVFPVSFDDDYDGLSAHTYAGSTRTINESEAPTHTTIEGTYAVDRSQAGGTQPQDAALIPSFD